MYAQNLGLHAIDADSLGLSHSAAKRVEIEIYDTTVEIYDTTVSHQVW